MTHFAMRLSFWLLLLQCLALVHAAFLYNRTAINGYNDGFDVSATSNKGEDEQRVRLRRSEVFQTVRLCFRPFFVGRDPPMGFRAQMHQNRLRYICQTAPNSQNVVYATMFDINYGIPVYSAYVINQVQAAWPGQFGTVARPGGAAWQPEPGIAPQGSDLLYQGRAPVQKGHLVPAYTYSFDNDHIDSTFLYTNAVPQYRAFNCGKWRTFEDRVRTYATCVCSNNGGDLFLLTGISEVQVGVNQAGNVVAHGAALNGFPNNGPQANHIAIPNSMWTAGCCVSPGPPAVVHGAFAFIGNNVEVGDNNVYRVDVDTLEGFLRTGVDFQNIGPGADIQLFPGNPACSAQANQVPI